MTINKQALKTAVFTYLILRFLFSFWAILSLAINPLPEEPDEEIRPYLNQPLLTNGTAGILLGPWQRFDALRYTKIAAEGYADERNSVFPPLYPWLIRGLGGLFGGNHVAHLLAGILISNTATIWLFYIIHHITAQEISPEVATRAVVYFALFPTSFFLFAPYSESLFILLALAALWQGKNGRFLLAGGLGFLASLTRLTGIVLTVPLFLLWWQQQDGALWPPRAIAQSAIWHQPKRWLSGWPIGLPAVGTAVFFLYRRWLGLRPLSQIYRDYWFQTTNLPGSDIWRAVESMFFGGASRAGEISLWFDFLCLIFLVVSTGWVFRRLGVVWGVYNVLLIAFMLLPTSDLKPLYSFTRYALAFVPTFMVLAEMGKRPLINRLVLYTSLPLLLYFSGQFFIWGWVA